MADEKFGYTKSLLVFGNLAILFWIALASVSVWFVNPLGGWLLLFFSALAVYILLRRTGCNTCAYCKSCTMGFGRLSSWFFGKRGTKDLNNKTGLAFVVFIYCILGPIPAALLSISVIQAFAISKIAVLISLVVIALYSGATWRKSP